MINFILGVESTIIAIIIIYILYNIASSAVKKYAVALYKEGYNKSQSDDTKQLLAVLRQVPYEYGNLIWKALTKTDLPKEEGPIEENKEPIGFHK